MIPHIFLYICTAFFLFFQIFNFKSFTNHPTSFFIELQILVPQNWVMKSQHGDFLFSSNGGGGWMKHMEEWKVKVSPTMLEESKVVIIEDKNWKRSWTRHEFRISNGQNILELTAYSRIILEKLIVTQLVKKLPSFMEPKVHYRVHNSQPLASKY